MALFQSAIDFAAQRNLRVQAEVFPHKRKNLPRTTGRERHNPPFELIPGALIDEEHGQMVWCIFFGVFKGPPPTIIFR